MAAQPRHDPGAIALGLMARKRIAALAFGLVVAAAYLAGASVSGRMSVLARRPLLDGYGGPITYRWASPPPSLAGTNQPPLSGKATLGFRGARSDPGVFRTDDSQAVIVLLTGSFPARPGKTSITLAIDPLAPGAVAPLPKGFHIAGNVYRIRGTYVPGGPVATDLSVGAEIVLVYPLAPDHPRRTLFHSTDGRTWQALSTVDSTFQQQASTEHVKSLGYFAVAVPAGAAATSGSGGGSVVPFVIGVAAIVVVLAVAWLETRRRRNLPQSRPRRHPPDPERRNW